MTRLVPRVTTILLGTLLGSAATIGVTAAQDLPPTTIQVIGSPVNSPNWTNILAPFWTETIPEASGGAIEVNAVSMTDLGVRGPELLRLARTGIADVIAGSTTLVSGEMVENDAIDIAGMVQDVETLRAVIDAYTPTLSELYREQMGVVPIGFWPTGAQVFWCASEIGGLADLQGKRVRVFSSTTSEFVEAIGAIPVTMAFSEVVPGLERQVIDCALTGANSGNTAHWTDVTTHLYPLTVGWGVNFIVANAGFWNGLDPAVQAFIQAQVDEQMVPQGWEMAANATQHGIWCTTGDERCQTDVTAPRNLQLTDLTLVPVTEEDKATLAEILEDNQLPEFAERCGDACTQNWNDTVGAVVDLIARAP